MTLQKLFLGGDQVLLSLTAKARSHMGQKLGQQCGKNPLLDFTRNHHPDWSEMKVKTVSQKEFEMAGKSTINATLTLALEMRSKCLWGFYFYPDCYNYNYRINLQTYTDKCPSDQIFHNDQLQWLWEKSRVFMLQYVKFTYFEICSLLSQ